MFNSDSRALEGKKKSRFRRRNRLRFRMLKRRAFIWVAQMKISRKSRKRIASVCIRYESTTKPEYGHKQFFFYSALIDRKFVDSFQSTACNNKMKHYHVFTTLVIFVESVYEIL